MRNALGIIFYFIFGIFLLSSWLFAFQTVATPTASDAPSPLMMQIIIFSVVLILALIALGIAILFRKAKNWQWEVGLVINIVVGFTVVGVVSLACIMASPQWQQVGGDQLNQQMHYNFLTGIGYLIMMGLIGFYLMQKYK